MVNVHHFVHKYCSFWSSKIMLIPKNCSLLGNLLAASYSTPRVLQKLLVKSTAWNQSSVNILHSFLSPRDLPNPGNEPGFLALQADSLPSEPSRKPSNYLLKCNRLCQNLASSNSLLFFLICFGWLGQPVSSCSGSLLWLQSDDSWAGVIWSFLYSHICPLAWDAGAHGCWLTIFALPVTMWLSEVSSLSSS